MRTVIPAMLRTGGGFDREHLVDPNGFVGYGGTIAYTAASSRCAA